MLMLEFYVLYEVNTPALQKEAHILAYNTYKMFLQDDILDMNDFI